MGQLLHPSNELDALPEAGQVGGAARVELQGQALAKLRTAALLVAPVVWGAWLGQSLGHALVAASPDMSSRESTPKCSSRVREIRLPGSWRGRRVSVLWAGASVLLASCPVSHPRGREDARQGDSG